MSSQISSIVLSAGGFGGNRTSNSIIPLIDEPKRSPDSTVKEKTTVNQVIILFYFKC